MNTLSVYGIRATLRWNRKPFIIATVEGPKLSSYAGSECWVSHDGIFGIARHADPPNDPDSFDQDTYTVTHIPSGRLFFGPERPFRTFTEAKFACCRMANIPGVDWREPRAAVVVKSQQLRDFYNAIRDATPLHKGRWQGIPLGRDYANPFVVVGGRHE